MTISKPILTRLLSTASGAVTTASQIFSSADNERMAVLICNSGSETLYIGHTSDVSASKHSYKRLAGQSILIFISPIVPVYLFATTSTNYTAHEFAVMG
jgi:hypothetical protein